MQWQDWVFSVGGFIVLVSLVPTLRGPDKPALTTSLMSAILIAIFGVTMATLSLWLSAVANWLIAILWSAIALQTIRKAREERQVSALTQIEHEIADAAARHE